MMKKQQGAVLIVSLIILLVTTLLGVTAMQSTSLEMKMAKNVEERQRVFNAAEAALKRVENILAATPYSDADLNSATCSALSDKSNCFDDACEGGLCFFGDSTAANQQDCEIYAAGVPDYPVWDRNNSLNVWGDSTKHLTLPAIGAHMQDFKYIIEFQCFVDGLGTNYVSDPSTAAPINLGDSLYRITVLASDDGGRINIMLQSTYSTPDF